MSERLRILLTMPYLPWPITSGGKSRQYHLLRELGRRGHQVSLLVQSKTPADEAARQALSPWVQQMEVWPRRALKHPLTLWHLASSGLPLLTTINGHAPALSARFAHWLDQGPWDIVHIEHSYGFEPFESALQSRQQPFVLTEHNVESQLGGATYGKWPGWMRPLARWDQRRAQRWERHVLSQAQAVVAVTEEDAQALGRIGARALHVVPNGVDTQHFAQVRPDTTSHRVLYIGNYEYAPNVDAVEWAMQAIWPEVWAQRPETRFMVCGHALPAHWRQRYPDPRIDWMGYVEDLRQVQAQSAAFLVPLRHGGGSKLKVLEAMAAGLPVISTPQGLSGLQALDGQHARVATSASELAQALLQSLDDAPGARAMGERARALVQSRFDWARAADALLSLYQSLCAKPAQASAAAAAQEALT